VERFHYRIEQLCVWIGGVECSPDFVVDPVDDLGVQEPLEDHGAISLDDGLDGVGVSGRGVNVLDRGLSSHE
jgi:hypothetical protein